MCFIITVLKRGNIKDEVVKDDNNGLFNLFYKQHYIFLSNRIYLKRHIY